MTENRLFDRVPTKGEERRGCSRAWVGSARVNNALLLVCHEQSIEQVGTQQRAGLMLFLSVCCTL